MTALLACCPVTHCPRDVLLFLASPRCRDLQEMQVQGLFLSDIPLHDMSQDFILLAEQLAAEADLKERYERLSLDLRVRAWRGQPALYCMYWSCGCSTHTVMCAKSDFNMCNDVVENGNVRFFCFASCVLEFQRCHVNHSFQMCICIFAGRVSFGKKLAHCGVPC